MKSTTRHLTFNVPARMDFVNITRDVASLVAESGVRGRGTRPAEEEQDQHGAQQHQPLNCPAATDSTYSDSMSAEPRVLTSCGSSVIAPFVP